MVEEDPQEVEIEITEADLLLNSNPPELITIDEADLLAATKSSSSLFEWTKQPTQATKAAVDIVLLVDTSGSMGATDYQPSRLEAAKEAARLFARRKVLQGYQDRVSLIAFSGGATVLCSLTEDLDLVTRMIDSLKLSSTGTMIGVGLKAAYGELGKYNSPRQGIVILSDGGDAYDTSKPLAIAQQNKNVKLFTIGIGTLKGGVAPQLAFKDQHVHLNEALLQSLAKVTGGRYLYTPDVQQLQQAYQDLADY